MSTIRIRCVAPPPAPAASTSPFPLCNGFIPSWSDTTVSVIGDDGSEVVLSNVEAVSFTVRADGEPATATLTFIDVDVDLVGKVAEELAPGVGRIGDTGPTVVVR